MKPESQEKGRIHDEQQHLPPRHTKHPSERPRLLRLFYSLLLILFIGLTVGLILWGKQLSTPLTPQVYWGFSLEAV